MSFETFGLPFSGLELWDDRGTARSGPQSMAVDEALLAWTARSKMPALRFYCWDRPTVSFGYFLTEAEALAAMRPEETLVRRWTGGGIVHHEEALTWSLAVPSSEAFARERPAESYARLHGALACCLADEGMSGLSVVPSTAAAPIRGLCAEAPAPGDLLWYGRKIAGAGQRRTRQGLLHQGVVFLPEAALPTDLPVRLAGFLANRTSKFLPPENWSLPTARYEDPAWNARR